MHKAKLALILNKFGVINCMFRIAFSRVLELDPQNVSALISLAVLDMNTLDSEGIRRGVESLSRAYQLEKENPVILNHLANHFFYKRVCIVSNYCCLIKRKKKENELNGQLLSSKIGHSIVCLLGT